MAEGAAFLVLERLDHAVSRGAHVYGLVSGYGLNCDAHHLTTPLKTGERAAACMRLALADAGLEPRDIGHINAHGTATKLNDSMESKGIQQVFGSDCPPVTGSKGVLGHMMGASGAAEAVCAILSANAGLVPPTANYERAGFRILSRYCAWRTAQHRPAARIVKFVRIRRSQCVPRALPG